MNINRKEFEERLKLMSAGFLSKEQHNDFIEFVHNMNDETFNEMVKNAEERRRQNMSTKDMLNLEKDIILHSNNTDNGYDNINIKFMSEEENKLLWEDIRKSKPTDLVTTNTELSREIIGLWNHESKTGIPSDILFMNHIPIMDMIIEDTLEKDISIKYRFVIFPDYQERIRKADKNESIRIGCIIGDFIGPDDLLIVTIDVLKGYDYLISSIELGYKMSEWTRKRLSQRVCIGTINNVFCEIIGVWYGIQISCLHPTIKEIFSKGRISVLEDTITNKRNKTNKNKKKNKIKYIKRHYISIDDINDKLNSSYNRKSLCWYVTGHWRTYKTGKKVFVKPYWKGILRESKNIEIRERVVDTTVTID